MSSPTPASVFGNLEQGVVTPIKYNPSEKAPAPKQLVFNTLGNNLSELVPLVDKLVPGHGEQTLKPTTDILYVGVTTIDEESGSILITVWDTNTQKYVNIEISKTTDDSILSTERRPQHLQDQIELLYGKDFIPTHIQVRQSGKSQDTAFQTTLGNKESSLSRYAKPDPQNPESLLMFEMPV